MKIFPIILALLLLPFSTQMYGQEKSESKVDSIEVFIIDSYIPPENPNRFILSFYTSELCKTKLWMENNLEFPISNELTDNHRTEIDIAKLDILKNKIAYIILMENSGGVKSTSEVFEIELHSNEEVIETQSNYFFTCLAGGIVFLTPSITAVLANGKTYFGLNKELPIVSLFSGGFNYPTGYLAVEYAYILKAERKNFFRYGYKHLYEIPKIEYISAGLSGFTDFRGFNGISTEVSLGLIKIYNVFTLYSRYRYNFSPGKSASNYSELSFGLYSSFFTLHW
ncbi:MAG: hypothetical protein M0Q21_09735 [Ignavibacteriaceae bacterium]|nr:hypothetical protein [Ignavibacteriaceae bacterium]